MTLNDPADFENQDVLLNQMKSANVDTIRLEGSSLYDFPTFVGIKMVKTLECHLRCEIPDFYFYKNQNIRTVYLGENIISIGNSAFSYSTLEFINFSESTSIMEYAFANCTNLDISTIYKLDKGCFQHTNLKHITIQVGSSFYEADGGTGIPPFAFYECYNLETVTINVNIVSIGNSAFLDCFSLREVILPNGNEIRKVFSFAFENCPLESINLEQAMFLGNAAFRNTKLKKVVLNDAVLEDHVFAYCEDLREVVIVENLRTTTIRLGIFDIRPSQEFFMVCQSLETVDLGRQWSTCKGMFRNCFNLKEIKSSNSELVVGFESFFSCLSLTSITISIHTIEECGFMFCKSLTTVDTTNIASIGIRAFYGCEKLTNISPHVLGDSYAFAYCTSLVSCTVQVSAGTGLLMNCTKLESVTLQGIQYIPDKIFFGCTSLKTVVFSDIIKTIGHYAFMDTKLEISNLDLSEATEIGNYSLKGAKIDQIKLGKDYVYFREDCDRRYVSVCPGVKTNNYSPLKGVSSVKEILIGAEKTEFEAADFQECNDLNIKLEEGSPFQIVDGMLVKDSEIFYYIPYQATRKTLTIPGPSSKKILSSTITKIHPYAFTTSKLEEVVIKSYIEIMEKAFYGCKSLKSITFNFNQQKSLDISIFENCISLTTVTLCPSFSELGDSSFRGCTSLETITIPEGTQRLGRYCFAECTKLKDIKFPSNRLYIKDYCFSKCTSLTNLDLSNEMDFGEFVFESSSLVSVKMNPTNLGYGIFNNCYKLEKVELINSDNWYTIGEYCFNSTSITQIRLPPNVYHLYKYCFAFTKIKKFFIPKALTEIHPQAFYGIDDIELELDCDHPKFILGAHELIDKDTRTLVLTYGKLLSTYIVPSRILSIGANAINSYPKYNETTGKVIDFGVTTLVIRTNVYFEASYNSDYSVNTNLPIFNAPYLHNLCYGGTVRADGTNIPRVFVSENYARSIWNQNPRKEVIVGECDSSVPFENYAKFDYTYPKNPKYKQLPKQILPQETKDCALIDDPYEIPEVEPEISPEENPSDQTNTMSSETNNSDQNSELINIDEIKPEGNKSLLTYVLLAVAAAEILLIAGMIAFLILKNKEDSSDESVVEMSEEAITNVVTDVSTEITFSNPLFSMNTSIEEDPFANDFEEGHKNDEGYFNKCLIDAE